MKMLILGGTTEASALARALAGDGRYQATLSLAGRTANPAAQPLPCRVGGFGGTPGLVRFLRENRIEALIDATHPFAAQISTNAADAASQAGVALLAILRPAWEQQSGDDWQLVAQMEAAAAALGTSPRRVFLTVGQKDLAPFAAAPWHDYLIRSVDPPPSAMLPSRALVLTARGPFEEEEELALLRAHEIEVLVTKNSGGTATAAKLAAARRLRVRVVMLTRPEPPRGVERVATAAEALAWLHARHGMLRGA